MRARLALVASQQQVEIREILLRDKPEHLLRLSPKATVPVLWLPDGTVIDQSLDVMRWALACRYPANWLRPTPVQCEQGECWLERLDGVFKFNLDRYKYPNRYDPCDPLLHRAACVEQLKAWDAQLMLSQAYLLGAKACVYDYAILPFVRQFRLVDAIWFDAQVELPYLQAWLHQFLNSTLFGQAMPRLNPWKVTDSPLVFPGYL